MRGVEPFPTNYYSPAAPQRYVCESCRNVQGDRPRAITLIRTTMNVYLCRTCAAKLLASLKLVERKFKDDPARLERAKKRKEAHAKRKEAAAEGG